ncbi:unnamed protein product [Peronospora destructor]|uniref:factor independent urate hydroxylase n=1 Tax=Peronospora destructor TaxID=86335 RepID=A0AAV0T1U2_9STRA|nr:unnamed protein product [Peronospora destructor]
MNQTLKGYMAAVATVDYHLYGDYVASTSSDTIVNQINVTAQGGVDGLQVLKTTQSAFVDFFRDEYTTLMDASDRLMSTCITAAWTYNPNAVCEDFVTKAAEGAAEKNIAGPADMGVPSPAVQFLVFKMVEAVLERCLYVKDIKITMPNIHNNPIYLSRFGCKNIHTHGEVFLPTEDPHGIISSSIVCI